MRIVINGVGEVTRISSNSSINQNLNEGEFEIEVTDQEVIDAFNRGDEILYNKITEKLYYEPQQEIDTEKAVLYEAVANLFEEVQILKTQFGGGNQ